MQKVVDLVVVVTELSLMLTLTFNKCIDATGCFNAMSIGETASAEVQRLVTIVGV